MREKKVASISHGRERWKLSFTRGWVGGACACMIDTTGWSDKRWPQKRNNFGFYLRYLLCDI